MANCSFEAYHSESCFVWKTTLQWSCVKLKKNSESNKTEVRRASKIYTAVRKMHTKASLRTETQELRQGILYV